MSSCHYSSNQIPNVDLLLAIRNSISFYLYLILWCFSDQSVKLEDVCRLIQHTCLRVIGQSVSLSTSYSFSLVIGQSVSLSTSYSFSLEIGVIDLESTSH